MEQKKQTLKAIIQMTEDVIDSLAEDMKKASGQELATAEMNMEKACLILDQARAELQKVG